MTEQTSLHNCGWTNIRLMCKSSKTNNKNPELFIIRSFGHNKNWHRIKKKRRWRRRWQRRRWRRNFGGKPGQSSTDLLCWSFDPRTGRSCLYDSLLHEKVQKYFFFFSKSPQNWAYYARKIWPIYCTAQSFTWQCVIQLYRQCIQITLSFPISTFCNSGPKEHDKDRKGP